MTKKCQAGQVFNLRGDLHRVMDLLRVCQAACKFGEQNTGEILETRSLISSIETSLSEILPRLEAVDDRLDGIWLAMAKATPES
jgi:hypothetical protein